MNKSKRRKEQQEHRNTEICKRKHKQTQIHKKETDKTKRKK